MSAALDKLTAEEQALLDQMQADDRAADAAEPAPTPEPAAETAPERTDATPEPGTPAATPDPKPTMVDKRALDEERARRRELEQKLQAREIEQAKIGERLNMLMEAAKAHVAPPAAPPLPAPEFEKDPAGYIKYGFERVQQSVEDLSKNFRTELDGIKQGTQQLTQAQQQEAAVRELDTWGAAQEVAFRSEAPDYDAAMVHLRDARIGLMRAMAVPEHEIATQIMNDVRGVANLARERGMNFPQMLYKMAQAQGYKRAEAAPVADGVVAAATPAPAANAAERLIRGQDMATTIGSTGAAPRGAPAAQTIANMSDAEFSRLYAEVAKDPARMRALFGE